MSEYSHIGKLAVKEIAVGPAGAEVPVIDADGCLVQSESHTSNVVGGPGTAARMPVNPAGYLAIKIGGEVFKVPFFKA